MQTLNLEPFHGRFSSNIFPGEIPISPEGIAAFGGDLRPDMLLEAYSKGLFPWYNQQPVLWHSPDPRCVFEPGKLHLSRRFRRQIKNRDYHCHWDRQFKAVVEHCAKVKRKAQDGTWIHSEMIAAYCALHELGYAHSLEVYSAEGTLLGGLYGLSLGRAFFGESMFSLESGASKLALKHLVLENPREFLLIDAQVSNEHLLSMGAIEISRKSFYQKLAVALSFPDKPGSWKSQGE